MECAQDILDELQGLIIVDSIEKSSVPEEHPLYLHLGFDPVDLDTLSLRSGLTIEALSAILLQLELEGRVATLPGGLYQRMG